MTHYAVLRHGFDIARNPDRLGGNHDEPFWLKLSHSGEKPSWLVGNVIWLVSWEGTMKMRNMLYGWYAVDRIGRCNAVILQHTATGHEGCLFPYALGPLDQQPWFLRFAESHRSFRDGDPTDISEHVNELLAYTRNGGCAVPTSEPVTHQGAATG